MKDEHDDRRDEEDEHEEFQRDRFRDDLAEEKKEHREREKEEWRFEGVGGWAGSRITWANPISLTGLRGCTYRCPSLGSSEVRPSGIRSGRLPVSAPSGTDRPNGLDTGNPIEYQTKQDKQKPERPGSTNPRSTSCPHRESVASSQPFSPRMGRLSKAWESKSVRGGGREIAPRAATQPLHTSSEVLGGKDDGALVRVRAEQSVTGLLGRSPPGGYSFRGQPRLVSVSSLWGRTGVYLHPPTT